MAKGLQDEGLQKGKVGFVGEKGRAIQTHFVLWKKIFKKDQNEHPCIAVNVSTFEL